MSTEPPPPPFLTLSRPGPPAPLPSHLLTHTGACHCGRLAFEVDAPPTLSVVQCNCSRCSVIGGPFCIVPAERFRLVKAEPPPGKEEERPATGRRSDPVAAAITRYQFNTRAALHTFCATCGVQAFYRPRSNPACVSVLVPALDQETVKGVEATTFDGRNWEAAFASGGAPKPAGG